MECDLGQSVSSCLPQILLIWHTELDADPCNATSTPSAPLLHRIQVLAAVGLGPSLISGTALPAAAAAAAGGSSVTGIQPLYVGVCVLCFAFPALASVIKDVIFRHERQRLGRPLDIFIVNSFGSLYQVRPSGALNPETALALAFFAAVPCTSSLHLLCWS